MFALNDSLDYYLYPGYIKMNSGMEVLHELIRSFDGGNPLSGHVYLFTDKHRAHMKMLRWDNDGFILYHKRLEQGSFELPRFQPDRGWYKIDWWLFVLILKGVSVPSATQRKRLHITRI